MNDILIKNALVIDGTGEKPYTADILIDNDKISKISASKDGLLNAKTVIDAKGMAVTPGFIDIHRHCDIKPFNDKEKLYGSVMLSQGITTTVVGNCGISMTPVSSDEKTAQETYDFDSPVLGPAFPEIKTYRDYMNALEKIELPLNFMAMIGTGNVKIAVKGFSNTPYTKEEMKKAQGMIEDALEEGAPAISSGIMYMPECYSTKEEFVDLLRPLGKRHGLFTSHIRGEGDSMVDSVKEVIEITGKAGCALEISHFKSCGMKNWKKEIHRAIALIEEARKNGRDVTCDFYPYEGGSTALTTMIPPAFIAGNMNAALERLGTEEGVDAFRKAASIEYSDWDNFCITLGWDRIIISGIENEYNKKFLGLDVVTAAKKFGYKDAYALAAYLLSDEKGKTAIINMSMCQDDIDTVAKLPYSIVISDSIYAQTDTPHPRMYGSFPKIIREYVNERRLFTLEEGIKKMTSLPAERMNIKNRGYLKEGYYADINIFDPKKFRDNATFQNPTRMCTGLSYCIVNGKIALKDDKIITKNAGKLIRNKR
ncbi:D-aminoacylase [Treponema parvum]|uniref:D-aminoacylase n=1 Tax=Treponema parvum TaxID=138851 RepID=A0A975EZ91_9SPIR|nr:D-aminoacylase [Treponema parvum]QTQ11507.1 D-aminoacylase [Treponema parvum]